MSVPEKSYDEIVDLFARTSSAEVLAFRPSVNSQERVPFVFGRHHNDVSRSRSTRISRINKRQ